MLNQNIVLVEFWEEVVHSVLVESAVLSQKYQVLNQLSLT